MKRYTPLALVLVILTMSSIPAASHCQIPCGIYNDTMRIEMMYEHIDTIEKSMKLISELSGKTDAADVNQIVRWVNNKEIHADALSEIATEYFLKQRIKKPKADDAQAAEKYGKQLETLHGILVNTMKAKQKVDPEITKALHTLVHDLSELYFSEEELKHLKADHH